MNKRILSKKKVSLKNLELNNISNYNSKKMWLKNERIIYDNNQIKNFGNNVKNNINNNYFMKRNNKRIFCGMKDITYPLKEERKVSNKIIKPNEDYEDLNYEQKEIIKILNKINNEKDERIKKWNL